MSMTEDQLVESVCISLNDFLQKTRQRVKNLISLVVIHIMSKNQWECTIRPIELTCSADVDWINLPQSFDKEIGLRRSDYTKDIEYITPQEYNERIAEGSTPYGIEAVKYTVMGGESLRQRRIHFLDPPASALTINMLYNILVDPSAVQDLPDEFLPVVKSRIIYEIIPPMLQIDNRDVWNPARKVAYRDYRSNLSELISHDEGQRGRVITMELDDVAKRAYQYYHP